MLFLNKEDINLEGVDLGNQIPVITSPVGYGKTTFAVNELRQVFQEHTGRNITNVLLLVPTRAILEQVAKQHSKKVSEAHFVDYKEPGLNFCVRVACFASPANFLAEQNEFKAGFDLVIIDEIDLIARWTAAFTEYMEAWQWMRENKGRMIVCGMTATPSFLGFVNQAVEQALFVNVTKPKPVKYRANKVEVCPNITLGKFISTVAPSSSDKVLVYTQSARECYRLSQQTPNSGFIVSESNTSIPKGENKTLSDLMNEQVFGGKTLRSYVFDNEAFPQEINCLFINDSCSVGMNLKDSNVRTVVIDSWDISTIRQVAGRVRHDVDKLAVIYTAYRFAAIKKKRSEGNNIFEIASCAYEKQQVAEIGTKSFVSQLNDLAKEEEVVFLKAKTVSKKLDAAKNNNGIDWIKALDLLDKEESFFTSKELRELCSSVGLLKSGGKDKGGVPTLIKEANASGMVLVEKLGRVTRGGKRCIWYRAAKIGG